MRPRLGARTIGGVMSASPTAIRTWPPWRHSPTEKCERRATRAFVANSEAINSASAAHLEPPCAIVVDTNRLAARSDQVLDTKVCDVRRRSVAAARRPSMCAGRGSTTPRRAGRRLTMGTRRTAKSSDERGVRSRALRGYRARTLPLLPEHADHLAVHPRRSRSPGVVGDHLTHGGGEPLGSGDESIMNHENLVQRRRCNDLQACRVHVHALGGDRRPKPAQRVDRATTIAGVASATLRPAGSRRAARVVRARVEVHDVRSPPRAGDRSPPLHLSDWRLGCPAEIDVTRRVVRPRFVSAQDP